MGNRLATPLYHMTDGPVTLRPQRNATVTVINTVDLVIRDAVKNVGEPGLRGDTV